VSEVAKFSSLKKAVAKVICHPLVGAGLARILRDNIPNRGCWFHTNSPAVSSRSKAYLFWGLYESAEYRFVHRYLDPDLDTVELGSGMGVISCHIARRLHTGRNLLCVEANPALLALLSANLGRYAGHVHTTRVHGALDCSQPSGGNVSFAVDSDHLLSRVGGAHSNRSIVSAPSISLSHLLKEHIRGPFQLVMDVEGAEAGLLEFDGASLGECRRVIAELHATTLGGKPYSVEDLRNRFESYLGFRRLDRYGNVFVFGR